MPQLKWKVWTHKRTFGRLQTNIYWCYF